MPSAHEILGTTYHLTSSGILTNRPSGRVLQGWVDSTGYLAFILKPGSGLRYKAHLHRLLAELYVPNPHDYREVNHRDGDKRNNQLTNLEWVSPVENIRHAFSTGLTKNGACIDYARIPKLIQEVIAGIPLRDLIEREGVKETSTLRKLLLREAIRTGQGEAFLAGTKKAKSALVREQSHRVIATDSSGTSREFASINEAARWLDCSPASIWKALAHGRVYRGYRWLRP